MTDLTYFPEEWCNPQSDVKAKRGILARDFMGRIGRYLNWDQWRFCTRHRIPHHSFEVLEPIKHRSM